MYKVRYFRRVSEFPETHERLLVQAAVSNFFCDRIWFYFLMRHLFSDSVATSLPIFGVRAKNRLTYATTDSFCPDHPASAASPYGIAHKWARHTTTRLPQ
jgi:hypothetical protein